MYYAQLDGSDNVVAVTQTAGVIDQPNMIAIATFNIDLLGKHYNRITEEFEP